MNELKPKDDPTNIGVENPNKLGPINYAPTLNYSNCLAVEFESAEQMNTYFAANGNHLLVALVQTGAKLIGLVVKALTDEELAEANEFNAEFMEWRAKRQEAKREAEEAAQSEIEESQRKERELLNVGRKCVEHHTPLVEENRKLKDEIKKLRKGR